MSFKTCRKIGLLKTFSENIIEKFKSIEATADKNQIELIACINNIIRPII